MSGLLNLQIHKEVYFWWFQSNSVLIFEIKQLRNQMVCQAFTVHLQCIRHLRLGFLRSFPEMEAVSNTFWFVCHVLTSVSLHRDGVMLWPIFHHRRTRQKEWRHKCPPPPHRFLIQPLNFLNGAASILCGITFSSNLIIALSRKKHY